MPKAVAVEAIFLIAVIAISLFFIVAIFAKWIDITKFGSTEAGCAAKKISYCSDWIYRDKPPTNWPSQCGPIDKQICCDALHISDSKRCQ